MTPKQALRFVEANGIVLESGRGPVPNLARAIAGEAIRGTWWAHAKGHVIFLCSRAIRESKDILVCRLVGGKVTYVHRRLWPALVRLAGQFDASRLAALREVHTATGSIRSKSRLSRSGLRLRQRQPRKLSLVQKPLKSSGERE